ncbi:MAG: NUDIX domain-containing protein [bacterium]|nr:NUDIX domain-containing protein [bacterium]
MRLIVVNEQDEIIGYKKRDDKNQKDITRVAGLWIFNTKGEVLIAQRTFGKIHDPGKWGPAVAGTVEEGETYISNIIKEAKEELGITLKEERLVIGSHEFRETSHKYFRQSYSAKLDLPIEDFKIQKEEVISIRWIAIEDLSTWIKERPQDFIASFPTSFKERKVLMRK